MQPPNAKTIKLIFPIFSASISVQNVRSIPKNNLTVKPASNEQQHIDMNRNQHNQHQQYMLQQKQQMLQQQQQQQHSVNNNTSVYYPQQNNTHSQENYIKPEIDFETSRDLYAQRNDMQNGISNSNWSVRKSGSQRELNELEKENAFLMRVSFAFGLQVSVACFYLNIFVLFIPLLCVLRVHFHFVYFFHLFSFFLCIE
jgi:hypothetical protein